MDNLSRFEVLTTDLMKSEDKEKVLAAVTGYKHPGMVLPPGFLLKAIDTFGRVYVVLYRGIEVLLLFKRATSPLSNLHLDVSPKAYLRNANEAWVSIRLLDVYPGFSLQEQIISLVEDGKKKDEAIKSLQVMLEDADKLTGDLMDRLKQKKSKKQLQQELPPPVYTPKETPAIRAFLEKIKPAKLNEYIRKYYLKWQGCAPPDFHISESIPLGFEMKSHDGTYNKKYKVLEKKVKKLERLYLKAKRERELTEDYIAPPPVQKKSKLKVTKKQKIVPTKQPSLGKLKKKPSTKHVKKNIKKGKKK